jgi:predicted kinase
MAGRTGASTAAHRRLRGPATAFVVCGAPAAGKSVLGAALAQRIRAALLDQDVLTGPLTAVVADLVGAAPGDLDDARVRVATRDATYDALVDTACGCLAAGVSTVLVAPFTTERSDPAAWALLVERLAAPGGVLLVWATCPPDELIRRMASRGAPRDRAKLRDLDAFMASPALAPPVVPHAAVDTTGPVSGQVIAVLNGLDERSPPPAQPSLKQPAESSARPVPKPPAGPVPRPPPKPVPGPPSNPEPDPFT